MTNTTTATELLAIFNTAAGEPQVTQEIKAEPPTTLDKLFALVADRFISPTHEVRVDVVDTHQTNISIFFQGHPERQRKDFITLSEGSADPASPKGVWITSNGEEASAPVPFGEVMKQLGRLYKLTSSKPSM
jgi:hypothetical protein